MSASEKLKALVHDMGYGGLERTQAESLRLVRALPQIVALVEAAEKVGKPTVGVSYEQIARVQAETVRDALSVLEEALS